MCFIYILIIICTVYEKQPVCKLCDLYPRSKVVMQFSQKRSDITFCSFLLHTGKTILHVCEHNSIIVRDIFCDS